MVVRREISWGRPCLAVPVYVVEDSDDLLVTYIAPGAPFSFADVVWPTATGRHPWWPRQGWVGDHGLLMLQRPGEAYAVWVFWTGSPRRLGSWYLNLQDPFRRSEIGLDTEDHELDIVVLPNGEWVLKDEETLTERVTQGRFTPSMEIRIRAQGAAIVEMLISGHRWWDAAWARWEPSLGWTAPPAAAAGWDTVAWTTRNP